MNGRTRWSTTRSETAGSAAEQDPAQQLKVQKLQEAASIVVNELPEIMAALVEKAKEGSYLHAKCAFELARISDLELPRQSKPEPWVEELLAALRALPNPTEPAAAS
jgi:hypothetical protein